MRQIRYMSERDGAVLDSSRFRQRIETSIAELRTRLVEAEIFRGKYAAGCIQAGDTFLDFSVVVEAGYDRTGPDLISAEVFDDGKEDANEP